MRIQRLLIQISSMVVFMLLWNGCQAIPKEKVEFASPGKSSAPSFALVELFTSEGCSSSPPADDLLAEIVAEFRARNQPVFALAFHVDYWNSLGWEDPFSTSAYSERQRRYAQVSDSRLVYTPQMIVNGKQEFVGSSRAKAYRSIKSALAQPAQITLTLGKSKTSHDRFLALDYEVSQALTDAVLHIALVEQGIVQQVPRGENAGRTLRHENVVRVLKTVSLNKTLQGQVLLPIPSSIVLENSSVIGYVQDSTTMRVLAAATLDWL